MIGEDGAGVSGEGLARERLREEGLRAAERFGSRGMGLRRAGLGGAGLGRVGSGGEGLGGAVSDARFHLQDLRMMFAVSETAGESLVVGVDLAGSLPARRVSRLMAVSLLKMRILLTWRFLSSF